MSLLSSVPLVTTPLALLAFAIAVAFYAFRASLVQRRKTIQSLAPTQRAQVLTDTLRLFNIDTTHLTQRQQHDIAMAEIRSRERRFLIISGTVCFLALLFSLTSIIFVLGPKTSVAEDVAPQNQAHSTGSGPIASIGAASSGVSQQKTFHYPKYAGIRLDFCYRSTQLCGKEAALRFCNFNKYASVAEDDGFAMDPNVGGTISMGDNSTTGRDGFAFIKCVDPIKQDYQRQTELQKASAVADASPLQQAREALEANLWQGQYFCDGGVADVRLTQVRVTPDGDLHGDVRGMMQFTVVQGQPRVPTDPIAVEGDLKIETGLRKTGLLILFPTSHPLKEPQSYTMTLDLQGGTLADENVSQGDVSNCVHKSKIVLRTHTP